MPWQTASKLRSGHSCPPELIYDVPILSVRLAGWIPGGRTHLPSFGEKLKQERLKRSITLDQISSSTKIGTRMLQALEEDKFGQLPGGIFNKGFVRAYARYLGLDEERIIADYLTASGEMGPDSVPETKAQVARPEARPPAAARAPSRPLPWGVFAALLLIVALALSIWSRRQHAPQRRVVPPTPAAQQNSRPPAESSAKTGEAVAADASPATTKIGVPAEPAPSAAPAAASSPGAAGQKSKLITEPDPAAGAPETGRFTVVILAHEDSWLSVTADGKTTLTETLLSGEQRAVRAREKVVLKCGNTGALEFVFDGKKLPSQGGRSEVKTLTFGPAGLEPAVAAPEVAQ